MVENISVNPKVAQSISGVVNSKKHMGSLCGIVEVLYFITLSIIQISASLDSLPMFASPHLYLAMLYNVSILFVNVHGGWAVGGCHKRNIRALKAHCGFDPHHIYCSGGLLHGRVLNRP